jgi:hypothetical protein
MRNPSAETGAHLVVKPSKSSDLRVAHGLCRCRFRVRLSHKSGAVRVV